MDEGQTNNQPVGDPLQPAQPTESVPVTYNPGQQIQPQAAPAPIPAPVEPVAETIDQISDPIAPPLPPDPVVAPQPVSPPAPVDVVAPPLPPEPVAPAPVVETPVAPEATNSWGVTAQAPVTTPVSPEMPQEPASNQPFVPNGFGPTMAPGAPQGPMPPSGINLSPPEKKGFFSSKLFVLILALIVFGGVIGGFGFYNIFIKESKVELLRKFERTVEATTQVYSSSRRIYDSFSASGVVSAEQQTQDYEDAKKKIESANLELEEYKKLLDKYNKRRGADFAALAEEYYNDEVACVALATKLNEDELKGSTHILALKAAEENLDYDNPAFDDGTNEQVLQLGQNTRTAYQSIATELQNMPLQAELLKPVTAKWVEVLTAKVAELDVIIAKGVGNTYITSDFGGTYISETDTGIFDIITVAENNFKGECLKESSEKMQKFHDEFDFEAAEKSILETINPFE